MGRRGDADETVKLTTWGWGVELQNPRAWVSPEGETEHPFWWSRRAFAERLALRYAGLGREARIIHASRKSSCTSPALDPWDAGYDPKTHTAMCGRSIVREEVPNQTATREAIARARAHERELKQLAAHDRRERQMELRARQKADPFGGRPGMEGEALALIELLKARGVATTDRQLAAVAFMQAVDPHARESLMTEEGHINPDWVRDALCEHARDALRTDPRLAERMLRAAGKGQCRTAENTREKIRTEKSAAKRSARAAAKIRMGKGEKKPREKKPRVKASRPLAEVMA